MNNKPKKKITFNEQSITVYSIGWLALLVDRTTTQVRRWEKQGVLPLPILSIEGDRRWYTAAELHGYSRIFKASNVRTGMSILNTPFQVKCAEFRMELRKTLVNKKHILGSLPEEASLERSIADNREASVLNHARRIADGIL